MRLADISPGCLDYQFDRPATRSRDRPGLKQFSLSSFPSIGWCRDARWNWPSPIGHWDALPMQHAHSRIFQISTLCPLPELQTAQGRIPAPTVNRCGFNFTIAQRNPSDGGKLRHKTASHLQSIPPHGRLALAWLIWQTSHSGFHLAPCLGNTLVTFFLDLALFFFLRCSQRESTNKSGAGQCVLPFHFSPPSPIQTLTSGFNFTGFE